MYMSVLYAPLFNSQLLEQKSKQRRRRSSSTEGDVEQIIYSVQINVVADIHISLGKSEVKDQEIQTEVVERMEALHPI